MGFGSGGGSGSGLGLKSPPSGRDGDDDMRSAEPSASLKDENVAFNFKYLKNWLQLD